MNDEKLELHLSLSIGRAYTAAEAATFLNMDVRTFNKRVSEGMIKPIWPLGERRFSGFLIAKLLGWPLTDDVKDYLPSGAMDSLGGDVRDMCNELCRCGARQEAVSKGDSGRITMSSADVRLKRHPLSAVWGPMASDVRKDFEEGIREYVDPDGLVIYKLDEMVLDGWWRYSFFLDNGIEPVLKEYTGDDPVGFVLRRNGNRRHQNAGQRVLSVMDAYSWAKSQRSGERSEIEKEAVALDTLGLSEKANVSRQTARQAVRVEEAGVGDYVRRGELHMRAASDIAGHDDLVEGLKSGKIDAARAVEKLKERRPPSKEDNIKAELELTKREVGRQVEEVERLEEQVEFFRKFSDGDSEAENVERTFVGQQSMIRTLRTLMRRWMNNFERMKRSRDYWKARAMRAERALDSATVADVPGVSEDPDLNWDGTGDVMSTNQYVETVTEYLDEGGPVPEAEAGPVFREPEQVSVGPPAAVNGAPAAAPPPAEEAPAWNGDGGYSDEDVWLYGADLNDPNMVDRLMSSEGEGAEPVMVEDEAPQGSLAWEDPEAVALEEIEEEYYDDEYEYESGGQRLASAAARGSRVRRSPVGRRAPPNVPDGGGASE